MGVAILKHSEQSFVVMQNSYSLLSILSSDSFSGISAMKYIKVPNKIHEVFESYTLLHFSKKNPWVVLEKMFIIG